MSSYVLTATLSLVLACSGKSTSPAEDDTAAGSSTDGGAVEDGGVEPEDTGSADSGGGDSGSSDTGSSDTGSSDTGSSPVDADGDGYPADEDCNDADEAVNPGAVEVCNGGIDDDCDGFADDGDDSLDLDGAATWYLDGDDDLHGDDASSVQACERPDGYVADGGDCDDSDPATHPGAPEEDCEDPHDYNCDGSTGYADADSDGVPACVDCDDSRVDVHPGADELCDDLDTDEDCDGLADDRDDSVDADGFATWYADTDGDGYGDPAATAAACDAPDDTVADDSDCDDSRVDIHPGADELCDDLDTDEDCDGLTDDRDDSVDADGFATWYADTDGDGYGDPAATAAACDAPDDTVADDSDCDDSRVDIHPGADELCDDLDTDEDCDGLADDRDDSVDADGYSTWFSDLDGDGHGDLLSPLASCDPGAGAVSSFDDCDDADEAVHPDADEICLDGTDQDCDGSDIIDADDDGTSCEDDCDDDDASVHPGATEDSCDDVDRDCDGISIEGCGWLRYPSTVSSLSLTDGSHYWYETEYDDSSWTSSSLPFSGSSSYDGWIFRGTLEWSAGEAAPSLLLTSDDGVWLYVNGSYVGSWGGGWGGSGCVNMGSSCSSNEILPPLDISDHLVEGTNLIAVALYNATTDYYLDVDQVMAQPALSWWQGQDEYDEAGSAVASAGDVNGDGFGDLVIGAWHNSTGGTWRGRAYLLHGPLTSDGYLSSADGRFHGTDSTEYAGWAVAGAGDVNSDGLDDILVSGHRRDVGGNNTGTAYLIFGPATGSYALTSADVLIDGTEEWEQAGESMGAAGDVSGDGVDDILVASLDSVTGSSGQGKVFLFEGPITTDRTTDDAEARIEGGSSGYEFGTRIDAAGDMNDDGYDDVLISAPGYSSDAGRVYLLHGPLVSGNVNSLYAASITTSDSNARLGTGLAGGADTDGDGVPDFAVSAPYAGSDYGLTYVFLGPVTGSSSVSSGAAAEIQGDYVDDELGTGIDWGDLDGDGLGDLVLGSGHYDGAETNSGGVFTFLGPITVDMNASEADMTYAYADEDYYAGQTLAVVGDVSGDALPDIAVGAPEANDAVGGVLVIGGSP